MKSLMDLFRKDAPHVYMNPNPGSDIFHYRGVADGPNDDIKSYKKLMEKRGHTVIVTEQYLGKKIDSLMNPLEA